MESASGLGTRQSHALVQTGVCVSEPGLRGWRQVNRLVRNGVGEHTVSKRCVGCCGGPKRDHLGPTLRFEKASRERSV